MSKFGVVAGDMLSERDIKIRGIVEKPKVEEAPSTIVAPGKYILTNDVFRTLSTMTEGDSGEIRLVDAFNIMLREESQFMGVFLKENGLITGDKFNFSQDDVAFWSSTSEIGPKLREHLKQLTHKF